MTGRPAPTIYGSRSLVEYGEQLVVVPRQCEVCWEHPAVYYDCTIWPASYLCRPCVTRHLPLRQAAAEKYARPRR